VRDGSPYHKGNPAASTYEQGETNHYFLVKATEEGKESGIGTFEELHAYGERNVIKSGCRTREISGGR